jgi:hypothetical protein
VSSYKLNGFLQVWYPYSPCYGLPGVSPMLFSIGQVCNHSCPGEGGDWSRVGQVTKSLGRFSLMTSFSSKSWI